MMTQKAPPMYWKLEKSQQRKREKNLQQVILARLTIPSSLSLALVLAFRMN